MSKISDLVHPEIYKYWADKYGPFLVAYQANEWIIICENGTLDSFHPSGDRLARIYRPTGEALFNNGTSFSLNETEYLEKINSNR